MKEFVILTALGALLAVPIYYWHQTSRYDPEYQCQKVLAEGGTYWYDALEQIKYEC